MKSNAFAKSTIAVMASMHRMTRVHEISYIFCLQYCLLSDMESNAFAKSTIGLAVVASSE